MKPTRAEALRMLDELYAQLAAIPLECKGRCADTCTVIDASQLERDRLKARGVDIGPPVAHSTHLRLIAAGKSQRCPALSPLNTCTAYDVRPLICRLFGMAEGLMCEHGCVPDSIVPRGEALRLIREVEELSEAATGVRRPVPRGGAW